ncbi:MAG: class I SAM-dependent methyltransferase [Caulobacteraceae bacterium]|nr:class I SAM-dependent methyltransferase [Caulobacter sp.]
MHSHTEPARLHAEGAADWDASEAVLAWLARELRPGFVTLETGAGRSTLAFAAAGCAHEAVTPSASEIAAIAREAAARGVDMGEVRFHEGFSQDILPTLPAGERYDVVFIDGGHGFPVPAVDFQFLAPRLKVGGALLIDDVDLWTGDMIVQVLKRDPDWRFEGLLRGRTAVFRKTAPFAPHEWTRQAYVRRKSFWPQTRRKLMNGLRLVAAGRPGALVGKLANERRLARAARNDR